MFKVRNTKIGDEIVVTDCLKEGYSDMRWVVTGVYPFCVLCTNLDENGKFGTFHRAFGYGYLAAMGKEKCRIE